MPGPKTRMRSRAHLLCVAALLGGVALGVSEVRAASFTVTRTDDTERGTCAPGDCSLREAIEAANALTMEASTITLPAGTYVLSIAQRLSMTADITITGAGSATTIVDGNQLVGVFDTPRTDEIDGVTVQNGMDTSGLGGGGIHNGGTLTATDLVLQGNSTNGQGGGLFNEGTAYLFESVLQNNMAAMGGGFSNTSFISVLGSFTIDGNTSTAEGGGVRNDGIASLDNTNPPPTPPAPPTGGGTISSNTSGTSGGGIHNTSIISLMNVALDGNHATVDGGALWNSSSVDLVNGTISHSVAGGNGAGVWGDGQTNLTNVTLAANSTGSGLGGAVWNDQIVLLDSSTVAGNSASAGGGTFNSLGIVEVRNTILSTNTPDNCTGGITSDGNNIDSGSACTPTVAGDLPNTDPLLGPLQHNPPALSFLETRAPLAGSPAIDAAAGCPPPDADERGVTRPQGAACDIGAVETEVGGTTTTTTSTTTITTTTTTIISATTTSSTTTISVTTSTTTSVTTTTTTTTTTVPGTTTTTTATTTSTINVTTTTTTATTTTITGSTTTTVTGSTTTTITGATTTTLAATTTTTLAPTEVCGNCADDDGNGLTDDEDPACCANPAAMQVKKVLIVPGPAGAMKGHLSLTAILAQTGFADVDPTRDDVTVQFHNPNGELLCATASHERWTRERRRGPFQFGDPTGTVAQGLRKMQIKVQKNGSTRFTTAGKKMDLGRYAQPTFTTTVRVGDRCSTATIALRNRGNKKFVFP